MDTITMPANNMAGQEAIAKTQNNMTPPIGANEMAPSQMSQQAVTLSQLEKSPEVDTLNLSTAQVVPQEVKPKNQATTAKKWGVGIASGLLPGLGQAINGQWGKAAGFFFGNLALNILIKNPMVKILPSLALAIGCIVDAVKNAKSKPKEV